MPTVSRGIKIRLHETKPRATYGDIIKNESIKKSKLYQYIRQSKLKQNTQ